MRVFVRAKTAAQVADYCSVMGVNPAACVFLPDSARTLPPDFDPAHDCVVDVELAQRAWTLRQAERRAAA